MSEVRTSPVFSWVHGMWHEASTYYIYSSILFSYRCLSSECWFYINVLMTMIRINILCKFWILFPSKGYWIWSMSLYLDTFPCFIRIFIYLCGIWYHGYIIFLLASAQNIFPPSPGRRRHQDISGGGAARSPSVKKWQAAAAEAVHHFPTFASILSI